jgi:pimeloyl-ACP methyl ester carboxylesterase
MFSLRDLALPAMLRALREGDRPSLPDRLDAPPVVLLHGFATSSRVLARLARYLERALDRPVVRLPLGGRFPLHVGDVRKTARRVQDEIDRLADRARFPYVDVVGFCLGGIVATYLLKCLDGGRRIRNVVTLSAPHRGTPFALLGAILIGLFSRAIWQVIPGSPLLRELRRLPVPEGSRLLALGSDGDGLVPRPFSAVPPAPRQENVLLRGLDHAGFLTSSTAFRLVEHALS